MVEPLQKPPRKNPQKRTVLPTLPPASRSRRALAFTVAAAEGRFVLQKCEACGHVSHPPREACNKCLSTDLVWRVMSPGGELIAATTVRTSINSYFRERTPWRMGTVLLDVGISVQCHLHGDIKTGERVRMIARTDKSAQGVMMALPETESENMADDKQLRELACDPKHRRVLIVDGRHVTALPLARGLTDAGAAITFVGMSEDWRKAPHLDELAKISGVEIVPLDITNTISVTECAGEIAGKVDILINNCKHVRPGGITDRRDVVTAQAEMEINYFGLMRLMQAFGPAMRLRGADGVNSACAWVNILSVYALSNLPQYGATSASQAAALSLAQCFRGEMAGSGVKVVNALTGPLDNEWHQPLPPPKVSPEAVARALIGCLQQGLEDIAIGDVARDVLRRWKDDPRVLEKELTRIQGQNEGM